MTQPSAVRQAVAASMVLSINELLEQILSELPPPDIFRYQRVNKTWYNLITKSQLLQYKSWLRDDYPDAAHHVRVDDLILEKESDPKNSSSYLNSDLDSDLDPDLDLDFDPSLDPNLDHDLDAAHHVRANNLEKESDPTCSNPRLDSESDLDLDPDIDAAHHVRADSLEKESDPTCSNPQLDAEYEYIQECYRYNIFRHLHPVVATRFMEYPCTDLEDSILISPEKYIEGTSQASLPINPIILRSLVQWYKQNKESEHIWGHISLFRPGVRKVEWELSTSDHAGLPTDIQVRYNSNIPPEDCYTYLTGEDTKVDKKPGTPLVLTVSDLMKRVENEWERWVESEEDVHYLSHDGPGCDIDEGIPSEGCLKRYDDSGYESTDGDVAEEVEDEVKEERRRRIEDMMESCIESAMDKASDPSWLYRSF